MVDSAAAAPGYRRLLIVDDEEGMRHMLGLMLGRQGFDLEYAEDGEQAVARLLQGNVDLVLADVRMPKLDNLGMLKNLTATAATSAPHDGNVAPVTGRRFRWNSRATRWRPRWQTGR